MNLSPDARSLLADSEEVRIETHAPDGTTHRTIIWVVVDGGDVFIRSVNGSGARWYREGLADPNVTLIAGGERIAALLVPATDPDSVERCSTALRTKYSADSALRTMLVPHALPTTLRVVAPA